LKAPTRAELERYFELDQQRLALQRQAKDLEKLQEELRQRFLLHVRETAGPERALTRCGYRLAINQVNGRVEWKTEFMRVAGVEAAEELIEAAPKVDKLVIEPPAKEA
jgi:hypothetical protein